MRIGLAAGLLLTHGFCWAMPVADGCGWLPAVEVSARSLDFVDNKTEYQLQFLPTEQSHPASATLSSAADADPAAALRMLFDVDRDIERSIAALPVSDPDSWAQIARTLDASVRVLRNGGRIVISGTGSTGRLASQIASLWRQFWLRAAADPALLRRLTARFAGSVPPSQRVIGVITGGDRALISSLEGFEDLQSIGSWQMRALHLGADDLVFAVTEGGETSAVIGSAWQAHHDGVPRDQLLFVFNNPPGLLRRLARSRELLDHDGVGKIAFTTGVGPGLHGMQAITGSTRMQATSSQTWLLGSLLQIALDRVLRPGLTPAQLRALGLPAQPPSLEGELAGFAALRVDAEGPQSVPALRALVDAETAAYRNGHHAWYFAGDLLTTLFIDVTERAPTFGLAPLDRVDRIGQSWVRVSTSATTAQQAWAKLLGREFRGLDPLPGADWLAQIDDAGLRTQAGRALAQAGAGQGGLYDFGLGELARRPVQPGDAGFAYLTLDEAEQASRAGQGLQRWLSAMHAGGADVQLVLVGARDDALRLHRIQARFRRHHADVRIWPLLLGARPDPLHLQRALAVKLWLNSASTLTMAGMQRVLGNSMIMVEPGNLKLTGRATYLLQTELNRLLRRQPSAARCLLGYAQANALLFEAVDFLERSGRHGMLAPIPLAIARVLLSHQRGTEVDWDSAAAALQAQGLHGLLDAGRHAP